jgi:hypothetical protein
MVYGRALPTDRSNVKMCRSMVVSWITIIMRKPPAPPRQVAAHGPYALYIYHQCIAPLRHPVHRPQQPCARPLSRPQAQDHRTASAETGDASFLIDGVNIGCGWRERNSRASHEVVYPTCMRVRCSGEQFGRRLPPLCPHRFAARGEACPPKRRRPRTQLSGNGCFAPARPRKSKSAGPAAAGGGRCNITCIMMMIAFMRAVSSCSSRIARK